VAVVGCRLHFQVDMLDGGFSHTVWWGGSCLEAGKRRQLCMLAPGHAHIQFICFINFLLKFYERFKV
jgi:hypothetical protein